MIVEIKKWPEQRQIILDVEWLIKYVALAAASKHPGMRTFGLMVVYDFNSRVGLTDQCARIKTIAEEKLGSSIQDIHNTMLPHYTSVVGDRNMVGGFGFVVK